MIFRDNINQLSYYTTPDGAPCYCEQLAYAADLTLQAPLLTNYTSGFTVQVNVYSADGLTNYEDATSFFSFYVAQNPVTGGKLFNLKLNAFSPAMCLYKCWILRVRVTVGASASPVVAGTLIFDKYTDKYCLASCCDIPRNITIEQEDVQPFVIGGYGAVTAENPTLSLPTVLPYQGPCLYPLIRITVNWPCYDPNTGLFYGIPTNVYTGTASFGLAFVLNIPGRIVQRPRAITRQISYNCKTQRAESFRPYLLEGKTEASLLPAWKMDELENAFHAPTIIIDGLEYQWAGGAAVRQITECFETFKLETTLQSCTIRVDHGCGEPCGPVRELDFVVPSWYQENGFFDENRVPFEDLTVYLESLQNVDDVTDVTSDYPEADLALRATTHGPIPSFVYHDSPIVPNRIFGAVPGSVSAVVACKAPTIGTITFSTVVCDDPVIGTITYSDQPTDPADISIINTWEDIGGDTEVTVSNGVVHMVLNIKSYVYVDPVATNYTLNNMLIGVVSGAAVPQGTGILNLQDGGRTITVLGNGEVYFSGEPTSISSDAGGDYSRIGLPEIYYNV